MRFIAGATDGPLECVIEIGDLGWGRGWLKRCSAKIDACCFNLDKHFISCLKYKYSRGFQHSKYFFCDSGCEWFICAAVCQELIKTISIDRKQIVLLLYKTLVNRRKDLQMRAMLQKWQTWWWVKECSVREIGKRLVIEIKQCYDEIVAIKIERTTSKARKGYKYIK